MASLEIIIAQIGAYQVSFEKIKEQWLGVDQVWFKISDVSVSDFNALLDKYQVQMNTSKGFAFFQVPTLNHKITISIWSVPCVVLEPVRIQELQTA